MDCDNALGDLSCQNHNEHIGGSERRGCVFISSSAAYDAKEIFGKKDEQ